VLDHYKVVHIPIDVYQVSYVPFIVLPLDFAIVVVSAVAICFASTIYPSGRPRGSIPCRRCDSSSPMPLVHVAGLNKFYTGGTARLHVLRDLDVDVTAGEMVAVVGASGVGKSTLLHLLGGLDRADSGVVEVAGRPLADLNDSALVAFRNRRWGSCFSSTTCCPSSPRSRTSRCRCGSAACRSARRDRAPPSCCRASAWPSAPSTAPA
jgi:hypothetical protein